MRGFSRAPLRPFLVICRASGPMRVLGMKSRSIGLSGDSDGTRTWKTAWKLNIQEIDRDCNIWAGPG